MHQTDDWISTDGLIAVAHAVGRKMSAWQIARWHRVGLLPKPRQQHLGRPRGSISVYPARARHQLLAILAKHRGRRLPSVAVVAWELWWDGDEYEIPPEAIRALLRDEARSVDAFISASKDLALADADAAPVASEGWARYQKHIRRVKRSWMGPVLTQRMTPLLLESFAGQDVGMEAVNALAPVIGEPEDATAEQGNDIRQTMHALAFTNYSALLASTSFDDVRAARDELKGIAVAWSIIPTLLAAEIPGTITPVFAQLIEGARTQFQNPVSVLVWLAMAKKGAPMLQWLRGLRVYCEGPDAARQ